MTKNIKLNIKNTQIAKAVNLDSIKEKLAKKKAPEEEKPVKAQPQAKVAPPVEEKKEEQPKIKARSRSAFAEPHAPHAVEHTPAPVEKMEIRQEVEEPAAIEREPAETEAALASPEALRAKLFKEEIKEAEESYKPEPLPEKRPFTPVTRSAPRSDFRPPNSKQQPPARDLPPPREKLGPTGRHVKDLIPPRPAPQARPQGRRGPENGPRPTTPGRHGPYSRPPMSPRPPQAPATPKTDTQQQVDSRKTGSPNKPGPKIKEFRDLKPAKKGDGARGFDGRDRQGLRSDDESTGWRKRRAKSHKQINEEITVRPTSLKVRVPISIKDLAEKMKLKASQLISKLFLQGLVVTLNDLLDDETTIQLLGHEFGCEIALDTSEEERIRVTDKTIREEIQSTEADQLTLRPPVVAFMGHVDHGKTSLIDAIRSSNRVSGEAGAITQHIGAFKCHTPVGDIAILDTPGHEAFSSMRARGADVTDIVVLVVAGDEGIKQQTVEAIQHAKAANVTILVAINKSDKPNFNPENVYRQLAEQDLLPEAWGGTILTLNCSAVTKQGIPELLESLALQAEVLELKANPETRARGTVIESEMHKGMGSVATILVQNGTLNVGDPLVFGSHFGRVKTMRDEFGKLLKSAGPSTPVSITGLSGLPQAGEEFIVVKSEKEAKEISEARAHGIRQSSMPTKKKVSMDNLLQQASAPVKKVLHVVLRADVQGSLEALKNALLKIESEKVELNVINSAVGEITESDVQLAGASKAVILGFHTAVEGHADQLVKELGVTVRLHDIIYHAIDDAKLLMKNTLDKIAQETEKGKALVKAIFKSSHHGIIAGCQVTEGVITRGSNVRILRGKEIVWKGGISSLKRVKEDVKEVQKGLECGIVLSNFNEVLEGDILEAFEITYLTQEL
ncbi:MAG: translation initiation factor IF-2 [Parachlamydiaceae bacterium]